HTHTHTLHPCLHVAIMPHRIRLRSTRLVLPESVAVAALHTHRQTHTHTHTLPHTRTPPHTHTHMQGFRLFVSNSSGSQTAPHPDPNSTEQPVALASCSS